MTMSEQIKVLCVRTNISVSELTCRIGMLPQNLNAKLKREIFTVSDLDQIAGAIETTFEGQFILDDGEEV